MLKKQPMIWLISLSIMTLSACQKNEQSQSVSTNIASPAEAISSSPQTVQTTQTPRKVDWQLLANDVVSVTEEKFNYPFKLDSEPVKIYAKSYQLDLQSARHQMTVGMASNELLSKLLDQLGEDYVSHEITTDKNPVFIVHTTPNVEPSQGKYTFSDPFAEGLSIDVSVINDGIKTPSINPHTMDENLTDIKQ
ncbi:hypothetical protein [Faucicola boevrei]|uniref:hypothetical protein n=1 Tax=Faucicola boevrei TaxID=346665 RepID=UPI00037E669A|nr:hypothetical protein [Moraxella boevrei]